MTWVELKQAFVDRNGKLITKVQIQSWSKDMGIEVRAQQLTHRIEVRARQCECTAEMKRQLLETKILEGQMKRAAPYREDPAFIELPDGRTMTLDVSGNAKVPSVIEFVRIGKAHEVVEVVGRVDANFDLTHLPTELHTRAFEMIAPKQQIIVSPNSAFISTRPPVKKKRGIFTRLIHWAILNWNDSNR